jgi:hypothetical protein
MASTTAMRDAFAPERPFPGIPMGEGGNGDAGYPPVRHVWLARDPRTTRVAPSFSALPRIPLPTSVVPLFGHPTCTDECPLSEVKRTLRERAVMSAHDPKRSCGGNLELAAWRKTARPNLGHGGCHAPKPVTSALSAPGMWNSSLSRRRNYFAA